MCNNTIGSFTDPRDGNTYKYKTIGKQIWMIENLAYNAPSSKCFDKKYGMLYTWNTAMTACPSGWHLPSKEEWQELVDLAGGERTAGQKLKATNGWNVCKGISGNGTDAYGFSALPGGFINSVDEWRYVGDDGRWWSSSKHGNSACGMVFWGPPARMLNRVKGFYCSVRCVKDD